MRSLSILAFGLLAVTIAVAPARAGTYDFSYSGVGNQSSGQDTTASGSGSFTTAGSTVVTMGDVTAFTFALSVTYQPDFTLRPNPVTDVFNYVLTDLVSFSADVTGGTLNALTLTTDQQAATYEWSQSLNFDSVNRSSTGNFDTGPLTTGRLTLSVAAPEPASFAMLAVGLAGLIQTRRRAVR
jgi:hypothetical protein